jgi:hypothetical protein
LVSVTLIAALVVAAWVVGKVILVAESEATGAAPLPESATVCGEAVALSLTERAALKGPLDAGVKVTGMLQLTPTAKVLPQVVV